MARSAPSWRRDPRSWLPTRAASRSMPSHVPADPLKTLSAPAFDLPSSRRSASPLCCFVIAPPRARKHWIPSRHDGIERDVTFGRLFRLERTIADGPRKEKERVRRDKIRPILHAGCTALGRGSTSTLEKSRARRDCARASAAKIRPGQRHLWPSHEQGGSTEPVSTTHVFVRNGRSSVALRQARNVRSTV